MLASGGRRRYTIQSDVASRVPPPSGRDVMATIRFTGAYQDLQDRLKSLSGNGEWHDLNENQKQFRHRNGAILNWYPSTGTINFQGPAESRPPLESAVATALSTSAGDSGTPAKGDLERRPVQDIAVAPQPPASPTTSPVGPVATEFLGQKYSSSELVIGLVGAVGTELKLVIDILNDRLKAFKYDSEQARVSSDVIPQILDPSSIAATATSGSDEFLRISKFMDAGNAARDRCKDNSVLALGVAAKISANRSKDNNQPKPQPRRAYIIHSLKHPEEVARLREIYPEGFYFDSAP